MSKQDSRRTPGKRPWRGKRTVYRGFGTMLHFVECDGIIMARTKNELSKLSRGFYLANFDPKKAVRVKVRKDK